MSTVDNSEALQEINELATFISHANPQVRVQASKMVTSLSALESNRALVAQTRLIGALARQLTDSVKDVTREVLKSLINFAESEQLCLQMMKGNHIPISMEVLRDPKTDMELRELALMFLVNLTRLENGARVLLQEGEEVEGLHVRRLWSWMAAPMPASAANGGADPNAYCTHILCNVSQVPAGRRLLLDRERGLLRSLKEQLTSPSATRRLGSLQLMKNLFMEEGAHDYLLSDSLGLMPAVLAPIVGNEPFLHGEEEYEGLWPQVRDMMRPEKMRDPDAQVRVLVYEMILLCARHAPSRRTLKSRAIYPLLRHAHDYEKERRPDTAELDEMLEMLVPYFILRGEDEQHPQKIEEERKKKRIEQLKAMNEEEEKKGEEKQSEAASSSKSDDKKDGEEEKEQEVVYLDDQIGGQARAAAAGVILADEPSAERIAAARAAAQEATRARANLDEEFPDVQPFGAEETEQLGEVTHNIASLDLLRSSKPSSSAKPAEPAAPVYAQPEDEAESDDDGPPPLADEEEDAAYMDAMD